MQWQQEFELAKTAAKIAGECLRKINRSDILSDSGRDIKHQADIDSEQLIIETLQTLNHPVLAEESGEHGIFSEDAPYWVIDPLDGTLNYSYTIPLCCVSIALWKQDTPILGVIYDFIHDELFTGIVGQGAWCNEKPIIVNKTTEFNQAILATGFPVNRDFSDQAIQNFVKQIQAFKKVRLLGSAALSLAYVAYGRIDAYKEENIMFWDVAAGIALVKAAGGFVAYKHSQTKKFAKNVNAGEIFKANDSL